MYPIYDKIGENYNDTRKADPILSSKLYSFLQPVSNGFYLDIGCGTGNYTAALFKKGVKIQGIDPSSNMLIKAREMYPMINWQQGTAEKTNMDTAFFDGIIAFLTVHHWPDLIAGFKELRRVLKPQGRLVIFTSTQKQMRTYWLNHYFPKMMEESISQMPSLDMLQNALENSGFSIIKTTSYSIHNGLKDHFLYSGKYQPELYFDPSIRNGISSFSSLANAEEVKKGLKKLTNDIDLGRVNKVISSYNSVLGDYLYITAQ